MTSANHDFEHALEPVFHISQDKKYNVRSQLVIQNIEDIVLKLKYKYSPIEPFDPSNRLVKDKYPQPFLIENAYERQWAELPPQVAAWLMILYDILILAEAESTSWVLGNKNVKIKYPNVSIDHTVVEKYEKRETKLYWNPPNWVLFWGRNIFSLRWQNFRKYHAKPNNPSPESTTELLAAGWIFCVLKTSVELIKGIDHKFAEQFEDKLNASQLEIDKLNLKGVMAAVIAFYELIQKEKKDRSSENLAAYEIIIKTGKWIETEFVYFLSFAYVPVKKVPSDEEYKAKWGFLNDSELKKYWIVNLPFIRAELNKQLPTFKDEDEAEADKNNTTSLAALLFADLFKYLEQLGP